ncbi:MAG TPA: Fic family protein [Bacteroidota bacterium]|jgi:Fic family protein|nr:Fic family protein [Bacteroidota bacterium]
MKFIESPPDWKHCLADKELRFWEIFRTPEIIAFIKKINEKYLYWDEAKYRPRPSNIDEAMAWSLVKVSRVSQMNPIKLEAPNGNAFGYWLPDSVLKELHFIDQNAMGQILVDEPKVGESDKDRYIISSLMEEAIASSILEGAATTRKKAKEMLREGRKPETRGELMIQNNYATMRIIKDRVSEKLSIELLRELQESMTKGTLEDSTASGRLRRPDEVVQVVDVMDGTVLHTPPPAENLEPRLKKLCDFANESPEGTFIHPVIKGIILHFWLAYEHPFVDGNGRTSRAIFYWYLLKNKYWLIEFLPISRIILKAPAKYKMAFLYSETDDEDITYFVMFNLRALHLSIDGLRRYVAKKQHELKEASKLVRRLRGLNHRQQELINHAIHHPDYAYTIARHMRVHGIVYQTARTDLHQLAKRGLLTKDKDGRTFIYYPDENLTAKLKLDK